MEVAVDIRLPPAQAILVGGAPLSGKTTVAQEIGGRLAMPVISTDHLGEAARAVTNAISHPDLHACNPIDYRTYFTAHSVEQLLEHALRAHQALWPAIEAVIRRRMSWEGSAVIEGWALLPNLVAKIKSPNLHCVWIESSESVAISRIEAQPDFTHGADDPSLLNEQFVARSVSMNAWLREQTDAYGLPHIVLSGLESPDDVSSRCLKAMGIVPPVAEPAAAENAFRATRL